MESQKGVAYELYFKRHLIPRIPHIEPIVITLKYAPGTSESTPTLPKIFMKQSKYHYTIPPPIINYGKCNNQNFLERGNDILQLTLSSEDLPTIKEIAQFFIAFDRRIREQRGVSEELDVVFGCLYFPVNLWSVVSDTSGEVRNLALDVSMTAQFIKEVEKMGKMIEVRVH